jgi:Na+-transporting NADH:ubiquinone oxidoreductase subunit NqrF
MRIEVIGLASKTSRFLDFTDSDLETDMLSLLRSRGVTIASSCDGEGVCKKCGIQNGWLTCMMTLKEFLERQSDGKIEVGYL